MRNAKLHQFKAVELGRLINTRISGSSGRASSMPICTMSSPGPFRAGLLALPRLSNIGGGDERLLLKLDAAYCRDPAATKGSRVRQWGGEKGGGEWRGRGRRVVGRRLGVVVEGRRRCDATTRERR